MISVMCTFRGILVYLAGVCSCICPLLLPSVLAEPIELDPYATDAVTPNLAADGLGRVCVTWAADTGNSRHPQNLYYEYSHDGGMTFSAATIHPENGNSSWYRNNISNMCFDHTGQLNLVWSLMDDQQGPVFTRSRDGGLSWRVSVDTTEDYATGKYPRWFGIGFAAKPDTRTLRTYWHNPMNGTNRIFSSASIDGGVSWTTAMINSEVGSLSGDPAQSYMSSAVYDASGNFYALARKNNKVNVATLRQGVWSSVNVTGTNTTISMANEHAIVVEPDGHIDIIYSLNGNVYFSHSSDEGASWSTAVQVDDAASGDQITPVLGLGAGNVLYAAWTDDRSGISQVRWSYSEDGGDTWSTSTPVATSDSAQSEPDMVIDSWRHHFVWIEGGAPRYNVLTGKLAGDANDDGLVDLLDFSITAANWQVYNATWQMGDFDGDRDIDTPDLDILADNWITSINDIPHPPSPVDETNLMVNPGFDQISGYTPAGWFFQILQPTSAGQYISLASPGSDATGSCLEFDNASTDITGTMTSVPIFVQPDTDYTFKGFYATTYDTVTFIATWRDGNNNPLGTFEFVLPTTQDRWMVFCDEQVSPPNAAYLDIQMQTQNQQGHLRIDTFSLREGTLAYYADEFQPPAVTAGIDVFPIFDWIPPGYYTHLGDNATIFDRERYHAEFAMANYTMGTLKTMKYGLGDVLSYTSSDAVILRGAASPEVWGIRGKDEPGASWFPTLADEKVRLDTLAPNKPFHVNLYPNYASSSQMGYSTYTQYVTEFCSQVNPDYITFDHYALLSSGADRSNFYQNFEIVRQQSLNVNNPNYGAILLSGAVDAYRIPNEGEIRWQAYSSLAYGSKILGWFTYLTWWFDDPARSSAIDYDGNRTPLYSILAAVNGEVIKLGNVLLDLDSTGVYHTSPIPVGTHSISGSVMVDSVSTGQWVVGELTNAGVQDYILIVNRDHDNPQTADFVLRSSVDNVYEVSKTTGGFGIATGYNAATDTLTLTVEPGDGHLFLLIQ